jgi:hypothetical protein
MLKTKETDYMVQLFIIYDLGSKISGLNNLSLFLHSLKWKEQKKMVE